MEPRVGDRISLDAKKVGQSRRTGVVENVSHGLAGVRLSVRWDDGSSTVIAPGAGVLLIEGHNGGKAKARSSASTARTRAKAGKSKRAR
jgi:hypothetical protein